MSTSYEHWNDLWRKHKYVSDYTLRWYTYLAGISRDLMPGKKKVLEVGSGMGGGIAVFARDGHEAYGVDVSEVAIQESRKSHAGVRFIQADLFDMNFQDGEFDLIFNSGLIEHFRYPRNIDALKAMERILKPGGMLIVSVPNYFCAWYQLVKQFLIATKRWSYGFEDSYSNRCFNAYLGEVPHMTVRRLFGMQVFPMLASPNVELVPLRYRRWLMRIENKLPGKAYYAYALVAECQKHTL